MARFKSQSPIVFNDDAVRFTDTPNVIGGAGDALIAGNLNGGLPIPAAPVATSPNDGVVVEGFTPTLQYTADDFAVSFNIRIATDSGFTSIVQTGTSETTEYVVNPALNLRNYYWQVQAVGASGLLSAWSTARQFITSQVVFTQAAGSELITDGGLENWNSATDLTSWGETLTGTSTVNRESTDKHGGSFSCRQDIDASNSVAFISQSLGVSANDWLEIVWWSKCNNASKTARIDLVATGLPFALKTEWNQHTVIARATAGPAGMLLYRQSAASSSVYWDDISVKILTFNGQQVSLADGQNILEFTLPASPVSGQRITVRFRENATTPLVDYNVLMLLRNDANTAWTLQLRKSVNGTISTPAGWSDIADVGSPDAIRVIANGDKLNCATREGGTWTPRGSEITETNQQTSVGIRAVYSSSVTVGALYQSPLA